VFFRKQVQARGSLTGKGHGSREFTEEGMHPPGRNAYNCQREYGAEPSIGHFESVSD